MTLDISPQEAQQLMSLLDLAVKAGGLQVAQTALPLALRVQQALDAQAQLKPAADQ